MFTQRLTSSMTLLGMLSTAYAAPYPTSSSDGFPNPNAQQLLAIEQEANGLLSNLPPPPTLSAAGITNFQLIAFNENLEVSFFEEIISNITNNVPGFEVDSSSPHSKDELLEILKNVKAQEELHAITAINTLKNFNAPLVPSPCVYDFPSTNLSDAITLASTLTDVVLGTLQDASQSFAQNGDDGPVRAVASVIGQEGEQNGFYRVLLGRLPSEKPFLTTNAAAFAFSALQQFVVSCPFDVAAIPLPIFPPLNVLTAAEPRDMHLSFSADLGAADPPLTAGSDLGALFVTYLVGQQLPISVPLVDPRLSDAGVLTFDALFPFTENIMAGLSIAALTNSSNFASADALVANTLAAPGLIEVNQLLSSPEL